MCTIQSSMLHKEVDISLLGLHKINYNHCLIFLMSSRIKSNVEITKETWQHMHRKQLSLRDKTFTIFVDFYELQKIFLLIFWSVVLRWYKKKEVFVWIQQNYKSFSHIMNELNKLLKVSLFTIFKVYMNG